MTDQNHLADLLEAAGETSAARIVRAAGAAALPNVPATEPEAETEQPQTPEQADRAAADWMLAQMKAQTPGYGWDN